MTIFDHQAAAMKEIVARMRSFWGDSYWENHDRGQGWRELPIQPRWHTLMAGPTGTGKTTIAVNAATAVNATPLRISAPSYIPAGAHNRGVRETIGVIAQAVAANARTVLVIDEIDKIYHPDSWQGYVRAEIQDLVDGRWPAGLSMPDDDDTDSPLAGITLDSLTTKLQTSVFVLGVGTFQDFYDSAPNRRSMGFGADINPVADELTADIIADRLPRELANRFSLIQLPELQPRHYRLIAKQAADSLPERMRAAFSEAVASRIAAAISAKKGVRFLEEAMLEILTNPPAEKTQSFPKKIEPCTP